jgi:serine/threonine protein kinase
MRLLLASPQSKDTSVTLLNDYIVLGSLGKGAYGSVKLCYSMHDDGLYALKVLQKAQLKRQLGMRGDSAVDMLRWADVARVLRYRTAGLCRMHRGWRRPA